MYVSKRGKLEIEKSEVYIKDSVRSYIWTSHTLAFTVNI